MIDYPKALFRLTLLSLLFNPELSFYGVMLAVLITCRCNSFYTKLLGKFVLYFCKGLNTNRFDYGIVLVSDYYLESSVATPAAIRSGESGKTYLPSGSTSILLLRRMFRSSNRF